MIDICIVYSIYVTFITFFMLKGYSLKKIPSFFKTIINEFPLIQVSTDENFHTYEDNLNTRYSVLYIPLGSYKVYILTWGDTFGFEYVKILSLPRLTNNKIDQKEKKLTTLAEKNYIRFSTCREDEQELHIKILEDKVKEQESRKNIAQFKAGFYLTGLLFILTTIIKNIDEIQKFLDWTLYKQIVLSLILLYIINIVILLFNFISVKGIISDKYTTLASAEQKKKYFYIYWYNKYQRLEVRTTRDVSFIVNIEKYLKLIVTWSIVLIFILIIGEK